MRIGESIIIQTINPGDTTYVNTVGKNPVEIYEEVKAEVKKLYQKEEDCFQEFLESGELEISGLPLNMQVLLFAELKKEIDGETVVIESKEFGNSSIEQYMFFDRNY